MRNKRLWTQVAAIPLIASLVATSLAGCGKNKTKATSQETKNSVEEMEEMSQVLDDTGLVIHADTSGKEETVYVIMDANGAKSETIVCEWLKNPDGEKKLEDTTTLYDIEVVKCNASYTRAENGRMQWETEGGDVYYQGKTDKDLPVDESVSYELDGKPVKAENLKNVSGHVKITYNYDNKISKLLDIGGEKVSIYQPFTMITGIIFDDETATNIKVSDGKAINSGNNVVALGVAMPGLSESIGLDKLKEEKDTDFEIPESVTFEADVINFTMPMSMTMATNDAISTLKLDGEGAKIDELKEKSDELSDGIGQIADGAEQLSDGMNELQNGTVELSDGVTELDSGAGDLNDGAHELADGAGELRNGASQLYDGTGSLKDGAEKLKNGLNTLNGKTSELASGVSQLNDGASALNEGAKLLIANNDTLNGGAVQLANGIASLDKALNLGDSEAGTPSLVKGSLAVKEGLENILTETGSLPTESISKLSDEEIAAITRVMKSCIPAGDDDSLTPEEKQKKKAITSAIVIIEHHNDLVTGTNAAISMRAGISTLSANYAKVDEGIQTVANGVGQLNTGAATLRSGIDQYTAGASELQQGAARLSAGTAQFNASVPALVDGVSQLSAGANQLNSGAGSLRDGAGKLYDGTDKLANGANELSDGTNKLKDGTTELKNGVSGLTDGVSQLVDGSGKLVDGIIKFDEEGISKITDILGSDIENYYDRIKAVKDFSKEYTTFSGSCANTEGTVKFIYKTDAVK